MVGIADHHRRCVFCCTHINSNPVEYQGHIEIYSTQGLQCVFWIDCSCVSVGNILVHRYKQCELLTIPSKNALEILYRELFLRHSEEHKQLLVCTMLCEQGLLQKNKNYFQLFSNQRHQKRPSKILYIEEVFASPDGGMF